MRKCSLHTCNRMAVYDELLSSLETVSGGGQGYLNSPSLFAFVVEDLMEDAEV